MKLTRFCILVLIFLSGFSTLRANFETCYPANITSTHGWCSAPSMITNNWGGWVRCSLDNGMTALIGQEWNYESQAKDYVEFQKSRLKGTVYVIKEYWRFQSRSGYFRLLAQDGSFIGSLSFLRLEENFNDSIYPYVTSITENITPHWFIYTKYDYVITLSDGSIWQTCKRDKEWSSPWKLNSRVMYLNGAKNPCLVNIDLCRENKKSYGTYVEIEHTLDAPFYNYDQIN